MNKRLSSLECHFRYVSISFTRRVAILVVEKVVLAYWLALSACIMLHSRQKYCGRHFLFVRGKGVV